MKLGSKFLVHFVKNIWAKDFSVNMLKFVEIKFCGSEFSLILRKLLLKICTGKLHYYNQENDFCLDRII